MSQSDEIDELRQAASAIYKRAKALVFDVIPEDEFDSDLLSPEQWAVLGELDAAEARIEEYWARNFGPNRPRPRPHLPTQARSDHDDAARTSDNN